MSDILVLLRPRVLSFRNAKNSSAARLLVFGGLGAAFWGGIFMVSLRILDYFQGIEELGDILAWKLLSMVIIIYFSLLIFSAILTTLSKLYLSKDLMLVHALPVPARKIFLARWIESAMDSSWMIIIFTLPVLISYGIIYSGGPWYFLLILLVMLFLSATASVISAIVVMITVIIIPPGRIKSVFIFLGLLLFLLLYMAFRLIRPERLVDPEAFSTALAYLSVIETPSSPLLPTTWAFNAIMTALTGRTATAAMDIFLLMAFTGLMISVAVIIADAFYARGVSKSQTARKTLFGHRSFDLLPRFLFFLPRPVQAYTVKEIKTFFRDQTQWSQIFLIGALIVIYIYNFKVLPLERSPMPTVYLQNLLSFLNMGLAAFVLTAVAGRFAYPAVSAEGEAFWLVRAAPIRIRAFLWIKFFISFVPLLILTQILIVATNLLLQVTPFMMGLSVATMMLVVPAVVALGIGLGAAYPDFNAENPTQVVTGFGGLVFMMTAAVYITVVIVLQASPVYHIFMSGLFDRGLSMTRWIWIAGSFLLILLLSVLTIVCPMCYGERRLSGRGQEI
jgi:ABC-2 type transport system permease protein